MVKKLILGIGQSLRGDDGAGLAVVKRWQCLFQTDAPDLCPRVELLELPGLALLEYMGDAEQVLIVDAVRSGVAPGSLHWLREAELAEFTQGSTSAHGWGVAETLVLGRRLTPEKMPKRVDILGIEIGKVRMGEGLSAEVAGVINDAAQLVQRWVNEKKGQGVKGFSQAC